MRAALHGGPARDVQTLQPPHTATAITAPTTPPTNQPQITSGLMAGLLGKRSGILATFSNVSSRELPTKGVQPNSSSYRSTPRDHQSTAFSRMERGRGLGGRVCLCVCVMGGRVMVHVGVGWRWFRGS